MMKRYRYLYPQRYLLLVMLRQLSTHGLSRSQKYHRIGVIGGGASGIFSAIAAASFNSDESLTVTVFEATQQPLQKVKISGGGRCNVMHDTSKSVSTILQGYPRGNKELRGLYTKQFGPSEAREWFEQRGVQLKTEADGRMFPVTDSSSTIMECLMEAADDAGVTVQLQSRVANINVTPHGNFQVVVQRRSETEPQTLSFDAIILATGSSAVGYQLAANLGHTIVPTVASLFTLSCKFAVQPGGLLHELSGVSVPHAMIQLKLEDVASTGGGSKPKKVTIQQEGPLLITHHGLSGPCALRLSAFAAREFAQVRYRAHLRVHWAPKLGSNTEQVFEKLWALTDIHTKKLVATTCPIIEADIPRRLWASLVQQAGIDAQVRWGEVSKKLIRALAQQIAECSLEMTSKGTFKEEFVTAGGVDLKEIDLKSMESKKVPGLYVCGELINVDGVTGGYNFLNCWGTGHVAGVSAAQHATITKQPQIQAMEQ
ncbi:hypothetical protein MPSEU_001033400 [Mayamaea pseudoterrestris]|nr:hypothetical protein MPSEU_001033400 [Mayamaea pseudoterrestris]